MKKVLIVALIVVMLLSIVGCGAKGDEKITIAHKNYTEQRITGQVLAVYLESKGYETEVKELAGTMLCFNALKNGDIDMYAEFTGSAYGAIYEQTEVLTPDATYAWVKNASETQDKITWLKPLGWNNTYVLSVRPDTAEQYELTSISDLVAVSGDLIIGSDPEFLNRADGMPGLKEAYTGLAFKDEMAMDQGLTYAALDSKDLDVNTSFSTDGRIAKFGFINLIDDLNFFPPYYVTPILGMEYADENPEIVAALNELGGNWNDEELQMYNLSVDEGEKTVREAAELMLKDAGLID